MTRSIISERKTMLIIQIAIIIMALANAIIVTMYCLKYEEAILFSGELPYTWGKTASIWAARVLRNYCLIFYFDSLLNILFFLEKRRKHETNRNAGSIMATNIIAVVLSDIYLFYIGSNYDETLYNVNEVIISSSGEPATIMSLLLVSRCVAAALAVCSVIAIVIERKTAKTE